MTGYTFEHGGSSRNRIGSSEKNGKEHSEIQSSSTLPTQPRLILNTPRAQNVSHSSTRGELASVNEQTGQLMDKKGKLQINVSRAKKTSKTQKEKNCQV